MEIHGAVNEGIERVVLTDTNVIARVVVRTALANDDVAGFYVP